MLFEYIRPHIYAKIVTKTITQCTLGVKYYTVLHLSTILSHTNVKGIHTLL